jgi:hypothetical protein
MNVFSGQSFSYRQIGRGELQHSERGTNGYTDVEPSTIAFAGFMLASFLSLSVWVFPP